MNKSEVGKKNWKRIPSKRNINLLQKHIIDLTKPILKKFQNYDINFFLMNINNNEFKRLINYYNEHRLDGKITLEIFIKILGESLNFEGKKLLAFLLGGIKLYNEIESSYGKFQISYLIDLYHKVKIKFEISFLLTMEKICI